MEYYLEWFNNKTGQTGDLIIAAKSIKEAKYKFLDEFKDGYVVIYIGELYG